jgi:hypothetical protein
MWAGTLLVGKTHSFQNASWHSPFISVCGLALSIPFSVWAGTLHSFLYVGWHSPSLSVRGLALSIPISMWVGPLLSFQYVGWHSPFLLSKWAGTLHSFQYVGWHSPFLSMCGQMPIDVPFCLGCACVSGAFFHCSSFKGGVMLPDVLKHPVYTRSRYRS